MADMLQVTPDLLRNKAAELREYRAAHDDTVTRMKNLVNGLQGEFKGDAANAFVEKFGSMQSSFDKFSELIGELSMMLDTAAVNYDTAIRG